MTNQNSISLSSQWSGTTNLIEIRDLLLQMQKSASSIRFDGGWSAGKVFAHCAQSIEYSLHGFPSMKPTLFRMTIGKVVFLIFSLKNKMNHGLETPIPGCEPLLDPIDLKYGLDRLLKAIDSFLNLEEKNLLPHFAYGMLSKKKYDLAHTWHIKNHMERLI
ncbi:MAG: DUF1569 domain-containing protein [Leptospira sp.]|nr:DUF1569 domain-containing protein [Leptospira sp.]